MANLQYDKILSLLDLSAEHIDALVRRGFNSEMMQANAYKTWPLQRKEFTQRILEEIPNPQGIPGFWKNTHGEWQLAGQKGLAIPVRTRTGAISGIKIRSDDPNAISSKYQNLSTNPAKDKRGIQQYPCGTAAKLAIHYPLSNKKFANNILIITEGELKADLINIFFPGVYAISLPGVHMWEKAIEAVDYYNPKEVLLAFDSDKEKEYSTSTSHLTDKKPYIVGQSLAKLFLTLRNRQYNVHILDWDDEFGKGLDDVCVNGFYDRVRRMSATEAMDFCNKVLQVVVPLDWMYVVGSLRFLNVRTGQELTKEQFNDKFACDFSKGKAADNMLKAAEFNRVDSYIYMPKKLKMYEEKGLKYLNLWEPSAIEQKPGDAKPFFDHINYILPNPDEAKIFLDWFAFNIQKEGTKVHWAILLQGVEGTGKGFFAHVFKLLLGAKNVSMPSNDQIQSNYTAWAKHASIIIVDEMMGRGRLDVMNKLKTYITEEVAEIREMFHPYYTQPNTFNFLFLTNHENSIILNEKDRRYCVFFSPASPKSAEYYKKLFDWTYNNSGEILYQLMNRDISDFNIARAPNTDSKEELIKESKHPLEQWIEDCVENYEWPFVSDLCNVEDLIEFIPKYLKNITPHQLGKALKNVNAVKIGRITINKTQKRLWCVRPKNLLKWNNLDNEIIKKEYLNRQHNVNSNPLLESKPM
jgi:hypothetical protein